MKKLVLATFVVLLVLSASAFAQETPRPFVRTFYLDAVYEHREGWMVTYRTSDLRLAETYLPAEWFMTAGGRGEMIYTHSTNAPYMDVYWLDGQFSHIRLFVPVNRNHPTWRVLPSASGVADRFAVDEPVLRY